MRTNIWILLAFLTIAAPLSMQAQGFRFVSGSFDDALSLAEKEGKMLLLITTASFSEASTVMVEDVMAEESVGKFYNQHFLGWVLDADPLEPNFVFRGIQLRTMPEYLFIDGKGDVQYRGSDFKSSEEMIALGKKALIPDNHASALQAAYDKGQRDPAFLQKYIATMSANGKDVKAIAEKYLAGLKSEDLMKKENWMITRTTVDDATSPACKHVSDNYARYCEKFEESEVDQFLMEVYNLSFQRAVELQDVKPLRDAHYLLGKLYADQGMEGIVGTVEMNFFAAAEDWDNYRTAALTALNPNSGHDATYYNNAATNFYFHVEDREALEKALEWAKLSTSLDRQAWNLDTQAALFSKLGNREAALKLAREAVKMAGDDPVPVEFSLELLKNEK
jgi:tetratricopeptide (TPR) repeat protein